MNQLATDPIFQTAVVPFAVALIGGLILNRLGGSWAGLSVPLGFYSAAWMIIGLQWFPLTSTHKILLAGLAATAAGLAADASPWVRRRRLRWLLSLAGVAAAIWVVWPVLARRQGLSLWALAGGSGLYLGWLLAVGAGLRTRPLRAGAAVFSLALGTGVCAVFGASTLLGQLAASVAAASGAFLLLGVLLQRHGAGATLVFPGVMLCGLFGLSGCVYAKLPWVSLPVLAAVPLLARWPVSESEAPWKRAASLLLLTSLAAAAAILVTRHVTGPLPSL